ncbi:MAG: hypothetical protein ACI9R3_003228 [Verrucomicrobiales bacterium]|jgi:hypothetical protein
MKKGCAIAVGLALLLAFVVGYLLWDSTRIREWGVGVDTADLEWIPQGASDITFVAGDIQKIAEFTIDRKAFEHWCTSIGRPLAPVGEDEKARLWRANMFLDKIGATSRPNDPDESYQWHNKTFDTGDLFFEERWPNNGGYAIGFDVITSCGFYEYTHH